MASTGMTSRALASTLTRWQARLRLQEWTVALELLDAEVVTTSGALGHVVYSSLAGTATVTLATRHTPAEVEAALVHELLHLVLEGYTALCEHLVATQLGAQAREIAQAAFASAEERIINRLERVLLTDKEQVT